MSQKTVQAILQRAITKGDFRRTLLGKPEVIFADYPDLSVEEQASLRQLDATILSSISHINGTKSGVKQFLPASFKEIVAASLSLVLLILLFLTAMAAFEAIGETPTVYTVGEAQFVTATPFDQAKDLLSILFPLFGAVVTFYLGVAVEGRRADQNAEAAEQAQDERNTATQQKDAALDQAHTSQKEAVQTKAQANIALNRVKSLVKHAPTAEQSALETMTSETPRSAEQAINTEILSIVNEALENINQ